MSVLRRLTVLTLPLFAAACGAEQTLETVAPIAQVQAATTATQFDEAALKTRFAELGLDVVSMRAADLPGLVEIETPRGILYSTPQADYFLAGTLYQLSADGSYKDVVAARQAPINAQKLTTLSDQMIEFKAPNEKYAVTVFTDITCGYCVKLHQEIEQYNDAGITVRYLAFPRQGPAGTVATDMAKIWCAENAQQAMHDGKVRGEFATVDSQALAQCQASIADQYQMGRELGISGTPAIFLPGGEMVGGYLPAPQLLQRLQAQ
ncbi:thioredoxin fold domain-containing protein [Vibrio sp. SM6]|uniref:Thiol:disulfide interchange protein n=1 Tax=Vibrio agarilyticus TaxID=2726741 RepID=A0A7X8TQ99_9VIBR|nr:thioredoxin fold domain-containing protein [Vibrio agarilyticus]NLS12253.1 thioredoxin fold domain-containing protein [Vibrio agarilyticus]